MGVLGARPDDLKKSLVGDLEATERVIFGYRVWPLLQKMLERLNIVDLPPVIHLPPSPGPDPLPADLHIHHDFLPIALDRILGAPHGDPSPQPNIALEAHLKILGRFRGGLLELIEALDRQIESIEQSGHG